jgi:transporter family protein
MPTWFYYALAAPIIWAIVNVADNFLVSRFSEKEKERSSQGLVLFSSLIGIFIAFLIWFFVKDVWNVSSLDRTLLILSGFLTIIWITLYFFALEIEETSSVVPWLLVVPIFGYVLGYIFLGEDLTQNQLIGSGITLLGISILSIDFSSEKRRVKTKPIFYMLLAGITIALSGILFKYVTVEGDFWVSSFWEYVGLGMSGVLIYLLMPHYRKSFHLMHKKGGQTIFTINLINEFMSISGNLLSNYALLLAPVTMVYLVGSFQPAIVLFLTILGTKFFPKIVREDISRKVLIPKLVAIAITVLGSIFLFV